jgi:predicted transcriptional regulator of viral defense system
MSKIPAALKKAPFTYRQAKAYGLDQRSLQELVASGVFEQVVRGIYRPAKTDYNEEDQYKVATLLVGEPSSICLVSALAHYGLSDVIPKKTWVMVPHTKRSNYNDLKLQRSRTPDWSIGIEKHNGYSITTIERTIVEAICNRSKIGTQVAVEALRKAVQFKKTNLSKIMSMAKQLDVLHRVLPYIEALS